MHFDLLCVRCLHEHAPVDERDDDAWEKVRDASTMQNGDALCWRHVLSSCGDCGRPRASTHAVWCAHASDELLVGDRRRSKNPDGSLTVADPPGVDDADVIERAALALVVPHLHGSEVFTAAAEVRRLIAEGNSATEAARGALNTITAAAAIIEHTA